MKVTIILSGAPGRMCGEIARLLMEPAWRARFDVAPVCFGSAARRGTRLELAPGLHASCESLAYLDSFLASHQSDNAVAVDYSSPDAALENVSAFASVGLPFVMGTTGFDRARAEALVRSSNASAVIAPNMAAPIVALQEALRHVAEVYPNALAGHRLDVWESHQAAKKDVSGTARALIPHFQRLGLVGDESAIASIRDPARQRELGVPQDALGGHGWHHYEGTSATGDVTLTLGHRVNGRRVYAEGTLRAVEFLWQETESGSRGEVFSMADVLRAGG